MPTFLTIHNENSVDRITLESRWAELSRDPRADWRMTLYNVELGRRYCEWEAPNKETIERIFRDLGIKWTEILEVGVTKSSRWRLWELESPRRMQNCWEATQCGRELGGKPSEGKSVCPAALDSSHWGKNRGLFAGRYCWRVAGTYCEGEVQGDLALKLQDCAMCSFFKQVKAEEGERFEY